MKQKLTIDELRALRAAAFIVQGLGLDMQLRETMKGRHGKKKCMKLLHDSYQKIRLIIHQKENKLWK